MKVRNDPGYSVAMPACEMGDVTNQVSSLGNQVSSSFGNQVGGGFGGFAGGFSDNINKKFDRTSPDDEDDDSSSGEDESDSDSDAGEFI